MTMSNESWNKGEWRIADGYTVYALNESGVNQFSFTIQGNGRHGAAPAELQANANLAKAAPELYEALKQVLEDENLLDYVQIETLYRCAEVLTKARGGL
jgi:hypothetical protein